MEKDAKVKKWAWWMILLWAYSTIWLGLVLILGIMDPSYATDPISQDDAIIGLVSFIPVFIFLILEGKEHLRN